MEKNLDFVGDDKTELVGGLLQDEGGEPHDALFFALGYLGVKDLLTTGRVCRSLRNAVRGDSLLWKMECIKITDNGLKEVLESNPKLTKPIALDPICIMFLLSDVKFILFFLQLCVPGCVRLSVNSILFNLRVLKSAGTLRIKHLRIGGLSGVTEKQFEELKSILGADKHMQLKANKPRFYHLGRFYLSSDDDCAIDIETCPKCQKLRLVYDCPAESCQGKDQANQSCRACTMCIARCINCGSCIKDCDYEETFCLDFICLVCLKKLLSCQETTPEAKGTSSSGETVVPREMTYKFCFYGE
ncbi:hypothetical protein GH714_009342 [Hevea brasiliensis]|uniref:F-box domain-containing protein n=1 Tax=Hevea brasiliensis TaxID=3981 RepID=A0A6A6LX08_HEVBR|nr:hypothetical protein GH714_009342 [Hevea brasiliensis]